MCFTGLWMGYWVTNDWITTLQGSINTVCHNMHDGDKCKDIHANFEGFFLNDQIFFLNNFCSTQLCSWNFPFILAKATARQSWGPKSAIFKEKLEKFGQKIFFSNFAKFWHKKEGKISSDVMCIHFSIWPLFQKIRLKKVRTFYSAKCCCFQKQNFQVWNSRKKAQIEKSIHITWLEIVPSFLCENFAKFEKNIFWQNFSSFSLTSLSQKKR